MADTPVSMRYHERAAAVLSSSLKPPARLVLLAVSHHCRGEDSHVWPSQGRLAKMTGLSRKGVMGILRRLESAGVIIAERRPGMSTQYMIDWVRLSEGVTEGDMSTRVTCPPGLQGVSTRVTGGVHQGDTKEERRDVKKEELVTPAQKAKPRKRGSLKLEEIASVEIPTVLQSLPGWSEAWAGYCEHRQDLKAGKWSKPAQVTRMITDLVRENGKTNDVVEALHKSAASGYRGVFPKPYTTESRPAADEDATIPASPAEAWERITKALDDPDTADCPGPESGWHLWPLRKDPRVHLAMMDALQAATGQDYPPHAWQMAQQARRSGADSFDLNQLGRAFRKAYPSTWSARVAA